MKISYAICVCNESKDLYSLISFLKKVKDSEDEINILVDTAHVTNQVKQVLDFFKNDIVINERDFDGKFATHRNYHFSKCNGEYIFYIDPDEMPQEMLIKNLKNIIKETEADLICIPRINIHPGSTQEWLSKCNFKVNECGWINWPDMQTRLFKKGLTMSSELHERFDGAKKIIQVQPNPGLALWHIKSVEKQDNRWEEGKYVLPEDDNLYDKLM